MKITLENDYGTYSAEESNETWIEAVTMFVGVLRCAGYMIDIDADSIVDILHGENTESAKSRGH